MDIFLANQSGLSKLYFNYGLFHENGNVKKEENKGEMFGIIK